VDEIRTRKIRDDEMNIKKGNHHFFKIYFFRNSVIFSNWLQRCCVMESCDFVPSLFSAGKYKIAKKQQTLIKLKVAIFYTRCWQ
jgi:hypothetical protein